MNPITTMISGVQIAASLLPTIFSAASNLIQHLPDIQAKFATLEAALTKVEQDFSHATITALPEDIGAAWTAGMAEYDAVGLPRTLVTNALATGAVAATGTTSNFITSAISTAESLVTNLIKK